MPSNGQRDNLGLGVVPIEMHALEYGIEEVMNELLINLCACRT